MRKKDKRGLKYAPSGRLAESWQDNQPWMACDASHELAKIASVLSNDYSIFTQAADQYSMVRFASTTHMKRVDGVVFAKLIQS